jgi:type I restriction enzyme S subunit
MKSLHLGEIIIPAAVQRAGGGDYPILSMTMHHGLIDQSKKFKKQIASKDQSDYKVVQRGQLVVGFPIDEGVLDFQNHYDAAIVSPAYGIWDLQDAGAIDRRYLALFLRSPRAMTYYKAKLRGSTARRRSLPKEVFLALSVPVPPVDEQRRIAAILDRADDVRLARNQTLGHLDALAGSLFTEMFGSPQYETAELSEVVRPGTIVTYGIVQAGSEYEGGVPYIRTGDIVGGAIRTDGLRRTDPAIASKFERSRVGVGDIVMSIRATVGTTALVPLELDGANLTQGTAKISPSDVATGPFLLHYLRSSSSQRWIQAQVKGATFREITLGALRRLPVPLVPFELQQAFDRRLQEVTMTHLQARASSECLDELFVSLQSRAFAGQL